MEKIAGEQFKTRGLRKDILIPITNDGELKGCVDVGNSSLQQAYILYT